MRIVNPIGKKGEDIAVEYLEKKGYQILERNYRKQYAEIDIIALQPSALQSHSRGGIGGEGEILVFVEVKTRTSYAYGTPFESITRWKLKPVTKLAEYYQISHPKLPISMRIDAIAVEIDDSDKIHIEHLENISGF